MSENFTSKRENITEYLNDEKLVAAYTCFYLLTNMPKLAASLEKIGVGIEEFFTFEIFDIGAGPGTFSLALLSLSSDLKITAIETSKLMQIQGERLKAGFFPDAEFEYLKLNQVSKKENQMRLGLFGHSANEMNIEDIVNYVHKLELDNILFIEPGTKDTFNKLLQLRKELAKSYRILYPCPAPCHCPIKSPDWCHQYIKVEQHPDVERLTQLVRKDRRNLPLTLHYYQKSLKREVEDSLIVRVFKSTKYSFEWLVCKNENEENTLVNLQIMKRGLSKGEIKNFESYLAGDRIKYKELKILPDGKIRGELI